MTRVLSWFSCGAASAVATKLALDQFGRDRVVIAYCETGAEHPDNVRFKDDCSKWFDAPIVSLKSDEYKDTWDVWKKRKYLSETNGAPCTVSLKVAPRLAFQKPHDTHVFGYTNDAPDRKRAESFRSNYPELKVETPASRSG